MGTYIADAALPISSTRAWLQTQMRQGVLRGVIERFVREQPEDLDAGLVLVEKVDESVVVGRIPCYAYDHENPHPFRTEVRFSLDLARRAFTRLV